VAGCVDGRAVGVECLRRGRALFMCCAAIRFALLAQAALRSIVGMGHWGGVAVLLFGAARAGFAMRPRGARAS
jgi:hypothetical protein